jgi:hypothetical protein
VDIISTDLCALNINGPVYEKGVQVPYTGTKPVRDLEGRFRETRFGPRMGTDNAR